jgi:hypothetical protein
VAFSSSGRNTKVSKRINASQDAEGILELAANVAVMSVDPNQFQ